MFDLVRNNKRIVQAFLALIMLPFALWGVDSYVRNTDVGRDVATVGGVKISQQEYQAAMREQQERMRNQLGGKLDPAVFEAPQMRRALLDSLITQRLLTEQAAKDRLSVSNDQLIQFIAAVPSLQENGRFSKERYEALVASQGMSKEMFESRVRQDLAMQQLLIPVSESGIPGQAASQRWVVSQLERREVAELALPADAYRAKVALAADAVSKHYEANRQKYEMPEQVRAEYLVFSRDEMIAKAPVADEVARAHYQKYGERYKSPETRRASHVLINLAKDAPEAESKAARAKAEDVLAQATKNPADFPRLAKQYSQDPGSAGKGGDLDWFGRGAMVKAFEDAVFAMKEGQISDLVRSDFGFHVIRLTGVRPERARPFEEVKSEIQAELKREAGGRAYTEAAEAFGNTVYEQSDSLKPAAEKWKLELRQSAWLARGGKLPPPFDNAKLAAALFGDDGIKNRRNSEAVEIAPGTLVSARVAEHKPASLRPLEAVRGEIEKSLVQEEASRLAAKDGEEKLARLRQGEKLDLKWSAPRSLSRAEAKGLPPEYLKEVFGANATKLPAYAGFAFPGRGYALYRISAVMAGDPAKDAASARALTQQYARTIAEEEFAAWMANLRRAYPVVVNNAALEAKER